MHREKQSLEDDTHNPLKTRLRSYLLGWSHFAGRRLTGVLALSVLAALGEGFGLALLMPIVAAFVPGASDTEETSYLRGFVEQIVAWGIPLGLETALSAFMVLLVTTAFLSRSAEIANQKLAIEFADHWRERLFQALAKVKWAYFLQRRSGELTSMLVSEVARLEQGSVQTLQLLILAPRALIYVILAYAAAPEATALAVMVGIVLFLLMVTQHRHVHRLGHVLSVTYQGLHDEIVDFLQGMKVAKSHGREGLNVQNLAQWMSELRQRRLDYERRHSLSRVLFRIGAAFALVTLVYIAVSVHDTPVVELIVMIAAFSRLTPLFTRAQQGLQHIIHMLPAYERLTRFERDLLMHREFLNKVDIGSWEGDIRLEEVTYTYAGTMEPALRRISLVLPDKATTVLIGPSGAGKSTLADLVLGLLQPDSGQIIIGETRLDQTLLPAWREQIAYVPQETFLFPGTIRDNFQWLVPGATEESMWNALEQAAAREFVEKLPDGLNTRVGERGVCLSGGERQRIALARAMLRRPRVLVLDEATSALDRANEDYVSDALKRLHGKVTILVIAHRAATTRGADRVYVLSKGQVWAEMNSDELDVDRLVAERAASGLDESSGVFNGDGPAGNRFGTTTDES